ncbi:MAG: ORF6N domain-containing protein, partial [Candidatus Saccharibacteria bacterium]|nr:ORF6N domain-containing protein [Candidatus Saccharibacteria bacterium]
MELEKKARVENMIYEIRGRQVMLASDIARLFEVPTGHLNRAMKRNIRRFPRDFCFQLTSEEYTDLICQIGISSSEYGGRRILPYVYTEQGVAMLASVIHSEIAIKMSVKIINAFVAMRRYIGGNLLEQKYINDQVMKNTEDIKLLQDSFA